MPIQCQSCPLRKFPIFAEMTESEVAFMDGFKSGELLVEPGTQILAEGAGTPQVYTVLEGLGLRYKTLENGRRQVINFVFPGDLVGLQAVLMDNTSYGFEATTQMRLCVFNRRDFFNLFRQHPERGYDVTWVSAVDEHFLGETVATLGQRSATERLAWALVRIFLRLRAVGLGTDDAVPLPYRQRDLAEALGLSLVHTNKTLAKFSQSRLVRWTTDTLHMKNLEKLAEIAMIDPEAPQRRPLI